MLSLSTLYMLSIATFTDTPTSFLPSIVATLGWSGNHAQLMSVPPYAVAFVRTSYIVFCTESIASESIPT